MLSVKNISCKIGNKIILQDVSANFDPGKINLVIGPNGAGKSTLIKIICGQIKPATGTVLYGETDLKNIPVAKMARSRAVLSQHPELSFPLKVWEVVMMGRYPHFSGAPVKADTDACNEAMAFFAVWDMRERNYFTLSGGEKQRANFARVLAQIWNPAPGQNRYLLLDEPLTFLDVHYQFHFMDKISQLLKDGGLVVVGVVHDLNLCAKFADSVLLLHEGKVLASGKPEFVLTPENIKKAYHLEPTIYEQDGNRFLLF